MLIRVARYEVRDMTPRFHRPAQNEKSRSVHPRRSRVPFVLAFAVMHGYVPGAQAQDSGAVNSGSSPVPASPTAATDPSPGIVIAGIKLSAQIQGGVSLNPYRPADGLNFGQLSTDHANQFQLNQVLLTARKSLDPSLTDYDWGFKLQFLYGSDSRYSHFLGQFPYATDARNQFAITEANVQAHLPWLTNGGMDVKLGLYQSPFGYEAFDPATNMFYSHSYISNFGLPSGLAGVLITTHVNSVLDIYLGADPGVSTTYGPYTGDNNSSYAGVAGIGLNFLDGNLTIQALTHIGPENPGRSTPLANRYFRYLNDVVVTWKINEKLTLGLDMNYIRDDNPYVGRPIGYGAAQYASYSLTETLTLNARAEVWRDNNNFYVSAFPTNLGAVKSLGGFPAPVISAASATTYGELTVGVTYQPKRPAGVTTLMIRPEIRWDQSLNGTKPFNAGRSSGALTVAADVVLGF